MESSLAKKQQRDLLEDMQRLTPEQRLHAFLVHCRLMMKLNQAGGRAQSVPKPRHP